MKNRVLVVVRNSYIFAPQKGFRGFARIATRLTPSWTSTLEVATISLKTHDGSEEPIIMRNGSVLFRHVRQLALMLISLRVDAVCYLGGACFQARPWPLKISFYVNSWPCTKNVRSNPGVPPMRFE
ncbi:MAG: hypothetical protein ETSY2_22730 [Candidatus Entotheonella gemina]|uniref:Uncharacterized protein n=1 Tax=Candidatus Entotheonella gemina TaxID=1429439 RepID=W4M5L4_9BACT|nr:MAG: hypothetical protein ETSY2_22730 [Candidatus Entotheonella gemina]